MNIHLRGMNTASTVRPSVKSAFPSDRAVRTLVLCDDAWHPANLVKSGLRALQEARFAFEFIGNNAQWSPEVISQFPLVIVAKANHLCPPGETAGITQETQSVFCNFVRQGGGLLVIHGGFAGCRQLSEMQRVLGGQFLGHPDQRPVTFEPEPGHLLTVGISAFTAPDEHYQVSLEADDADIFLRTHSEGGVQPAGWTRREGRGRVCVLTPGHDRDVWLHPKFLQLLRNGLGWLARFH